MFKAIYYKIRSHPVLITILLTPFVLLLLLNILNPLLRTTSGATYCAPPPPPTVLEGQIGIFPSPITEWPGYIIVVLALYFLIFLISRAWKAFTEEPVYEEIDSLEPKGPSILRIVAPSLLIILALIVGSIGLTILDGLRWIGSGSFGRLLSDVMDVVNSLIIPVILLVMLIQFFWGAFLYLLLGLDGNRLARRKGRIYMVFSLFLLIPVMFFWAMVNLLTSSIGLESGAMYNTPSVPSGGFVSSRGAMESAQVSDNTLGFSVGGAKDVDNFRENIEQCYLPIPTDVTYEGLFYDYIFETKNQSGCTALFCPQYEAAVVPDPFNGVDEYFLSVGLGSNIDADTFSRMPLDVVVVLDISGSMSSPFDRYYYDQFRDPANRPENADWNSSKMDIAKEALGAMVDRLQPDDRLGIVVFDSTAETRARIEPMGQNGFSTAKNAIYALQPRGGTNMEAGLEAGTELIKSFTQEDGVDRERRIIFLTDAMPNTGAIEQNDLYTIGQRNAEEGIHTTYIGVGVDFNTELIEALSKEIKGANYYAIHSSEDFEKRLDIEFEYMVSPLVFDLALEIKGGDYEIRTVYGSPEAHLATGEIMNVSTLFPSPTAEGNSRGGVILVHMEKVRNTGTPTQVVASYTDRAGQHFAATATVPWRDVTGDKASPNVRKAVLLARYANLMQNWIIDENLRLGIPEKTIYRTIQPRVFYSEGLMIPRERYVSPNVYRPTQYELNYWERLSRELVVSRDYKQLFKDFRVYMEQESKSVSETEKLQDEVQILKNLEHSPDSDYDVEEEKTGVDSITRDRNEE